MSVAPSSPTAADGTVAAPRLRRLVPPPAVLRLAEAAASGGGYSKRHVGPVYTFVKTDPKANFKWGVRHRVGTQYGR